ncbi:hypothetical protein FJZ36_12940, partial [Candidatus Poribacteria bacterium]|nr:hypothetical protein [Candidatus Poribacteria bacterium]
MKRVTRLRMLFAASAVALFAFLSPVHALLLNGNYLRVGVNGGGSLFDSATSNSVRFDPTGTGTFGAADFFYPGSPVEGWTIKIDGTVYAQTSPSVGIVGTLTDTSAGTTLRAHYLSNPIAATGIRVEQVIAFDIAGQVIRFDVYVTNTSSVARTVKYMRYGDPDQGANVGAGYNTLNDVQLVPQGKLVTAETTSHGTVGFGALGLSDAVAFQVVAFETGVTGSTNDPDVVLSAPNDPNGASGDDTVHVAFDVGSIAPGATKSFSHYTVFGPTALDVVALFNDLDATPAGPAALVTLSGAASFLNPDAPRTLIASITDAAGHRLREDNSTVVTFEQLNALDEGAGTVNGLGPVTVVEGRATLTITGGALGPVVIGASADGLAPGFGNPVSFSVSPTVPLPYALRDGLSWDWTIQQDGEVEGTDSAFSWGFWLQTNGYGFPNRTTALASLAGRQVEIGPQVITASEAGDGLEITRKVYVSPTDGFIRYLEIYNNTWTSDIEATAYIRSYSGGEGTSTVRTSSGDNLFDTEDNWIAQHDFYYPATAVVTAGDGGAIRPSYAEYYGDYRIQYQYDFTVPAGQQRIIMHFGAQRSSVDAAEAAAISLANLTPPDALVDMSDAERNAVINWSINATSGPATQIALYGGTATLRPEASRTFTAIIQDADGLRVVGDNTTPITFTRSDASGTTALGTVTAVAGRAQFTMLGGAEGEVTIQASGGVPLAAGPGNPVSFLVFSIVNISDGLTLEDSQGFQWDIQSDGDISDGTSDAFDGGLYLTTDTSGTRSFDWFPGQSTGRMEAAGRQLVLGPALMGGEVSPAVEVTRRIYIPRASAFARFFEDIHNPNEEPVTVTIKIESNLGSDGDETFLETSSGDDIFDADDNWYVSDDPYGPPPEGDPAVAFVIAGDGGLIRPSAASRDYDDIIYEYVVDIPAGETVSILHYSAQRNSGDEGVSIAMELEALLGDALGGMTPEQLARVQNFPTSPTSPYAIAKLSGDGASAPVGSAHPFIARVQNYFGDPVEGAEVAFAVIEGGGTLAESSAISNADGEVVANLTLGATPGLNRVQMSVGSHVATFSVTGTRIIPVLSSISPVHVVAGASSVTLTLSGDKFNADAVVQWNGSDRPTTWVSITELTAEIPSTDLATAAEANVTVVNPGVAGDTSVIKKFRVRHPLIVVSNSGTVPLTVNQIAYDAKLYDILPHASFGVPAGGVQGIAIDFATIPIGSAS